MKTKMDSFSLTSKEGITYMNCHPSEAEKSLVRHSGNREKFTLRILPFQKTEEPVKITVKVKGQNNIFLFNETNCPG